ncbi:MAG: hypothetical protein LBV13_02095 [Methanomassiliicoccaceae archaeon]|jgi:hypothetical protein|nr:hypothetical protein [Methanomassiliicoccaceae archaeon]
MSDVKISINAGICGFTTKVVATLLEDYQTVKFISIESGCPNIKNMIGKLKEADSINAVGTRPPENILMKKCYEFIPHPACPVPCGMVKACEAAAGLALKKESWIKFE